MGEGQSLLAANGQPRPAGGSGSAQRAPLAIAAIVVLAAIAAWASLKGFDDVRYQLADLKEDPLYLRGPGFTIVAGVVVSIIVAVFALWARLLGRPTVPVARPRTARLRWHWWYVLVAGWAGYGLGAGIALAGGGPVLHPGTMRLELGTPLAASLEVPATCKAAPGRPAQVVAVAGDGPGMPYLQLANEVSGAPVPWPTPGSVNLVRLGESRGGEDVPIPGLPERPPILSLSLGFRPGPPAPQPALQVLERPISFMRTYLYVPIDSEVSESAGVARFRADRTYGIMVADTLIPDDPWPESYALTIRWTCDLGATKALPTPTPTPTLERATAVPAGTAAPPPPAVVPLDLRLATSSEAATVEITGATIDAVDPPTVEGAGGSAEYRDGVFRLEQPASAAGQGHVVGATFRVSLRGVTAESKVGLTIAGGPAGRVGVTVYNLRGEEPVPVFANVGTSADQPGWPIQVGGEWLVEPIDVESLD